MIRKGIKKIIKISSGELTTFEAFVKVTLNQFCKTRQVESSKCMSYVTSLKALSIAGKDIIIYLLNISF